MTRVSWANKNPKRFFMEMKKCGDAESRLLPEYAYQPRGGEV
jgi:hypothetical protein